MRSLYLRIWLTVVAALALFALVSGWLVQRHLEEQRERSERVVQERVAAWADLLQATLPPADAPLAEQAQGLLDWGQRQRVPMALDAADGRRIVATESFVRRGLDEPGARERLRAAWGVGPDDWLVVTLGRGEHSKGWDLLVQAFERAALPGARLVLVGQGPDWQAVRSAAGADVVMPGFTNEPANCLAAFDLFVSAARSEPFGLVFLEAMHAGLPILATATEGAQHLQASFEPLLPCGDAAALAAALARQHALLPARRAHPVEPYALPARVAEIEAFYRACGAR